MNTWEWLTSNSAAPSGDAWWRLTHPAQGSGSGSCIITDEIRISARKSIPINTKYYGVKIKSKLPIGIHVQDNKIVIKERDKNVIH